MAIVYRHIRLDKNEAFYIGIGKTIKRAYSKSNRNNYWQNIAKNGYEVEIIFDNLSWDEACRKEKEFIAYYGRKNNNTGMLVNLTDGGDGKVGFITPEQVKNKMSQTKKGHLTSNETKVKISNSLKGIAFTAERKINVSNGRKGKGIGPCSNEKKKSISKAKLGKTQKKIVCAYCKKEGGELAMKRYHLDNCKYKIQHNY